MFHTNWSELRTCQITSLEIGMYPADSGSPEGDHAKGKFAENFSDGVAVFSKLLKKSCQ